MSVVKKEGQMAVKVKYFLVLPEDDGQRLDNYLIKKLKGVPKAHIYRIIRKGEVRVNKKRIVAKYRLIAGDSIRVPPVSLKEEALHIAPSLTTMRLLTERILYEDEHVLIINKPAGMSVHSGSSVRIGVIEALRHAFPKLKQLELAHRLDAETSGCLVLAKRRSILKELHALLREGEVSKIYWALTKGRWKKTELRVDLPLNKIYLKDKSHQVRVSDKGKNALTVFHPIKIFTDASLMEVNLHTGRTHQIRVHAAHFGHPIAGDSRYGDETFNQAVNDRGLKRMFLHARSIKFTLPSLNQTFSVVAPLDPELERCLQVFEKIK